MPMSEEDEVFVEKCFQRSLVVGFHISLSLSAYSNSKRVGSPPLGTRQTRLLQRYANISLAPDGRDLPSRT